MINKTDKTYIVLFKSIQLARLQLSALQVKRELEKNKPITLNGDEGVLNSLFTSFKNEFKNGKTNQLNGVQQNIQAEIERFAGENDVKTLYPFNEIPKIISEAFSDDIYAIEKTMLSISIIFDNEYKYEYESETLKQISECIWSDSYHLANMKSHIESIYKDLARQPLSTSQKLLLGGSAVLALSSFVVAPACFAVIGSGGEILSGLAAFGAAAGVGEAAVAGIGVLGVLELLLDSALIGFAYALLDGYNKEKVKKSFREMNYNNAARMLAIKCHIMHVAKQTMPENIFKEKFSELLQMLQDLKSDTDYVMLVENQNVEENTKKIKVFHNLDDKLAKMFC